MKKIVLSSLFVVSIAGYVIYQNMTGQTNTAAISNNKNQQAAQTTASVSSNNGESVVNPISKPALNIKSPAKTTASNTGMYKNGAYTGDVADAYYGNVQVEAVIKGGKISDVIFLQYPNSHGHSVEINNSAMPILKSEAIQAQNANVDTVSGATETSGAFQNSLASALALAKN